MNIDPSYSHTLQFYGYEDTPEHRRAFGDGLLGRPHPGSEATLTVRQLYLTGEFQRQNQERVQLPNPELAGTIARIHAGEVGTHEAVILNERTARAERIAATTTIEAGQPLPERLEAIAAELVECALILRAYADQPMSPR